VMVANSAELVMPNRTSCSHVSADACRLYLDGTPAALKVAADENADETSRFIAANKAQPRLVFPHHLPNV